MFILDQRQNYKVILKQHKYLIVKGEALDVPGLVTSALKSNISVAYPGSSAGVQNPQPYKYSWMGSPDNSTTSGNTRNCTQELTNLIEPTIFDGHLRKISISL